MSQFREMRILKTIQARLRTGDIAASDRLDAATLAYIEHPTDSAARERFRRFLTLAANTGSIRAEAEPVMSYPQRVFQPLPDWQIERQDYRQWRAHCPPSLLSEMTLIRCWLEPPEPSKAGKRQVLKAGEVWRNTHPGESRRALKTALAAQFDIEIKDYWIDLIMDNTTDIPRSRGGRSDPPLE